MSSTKESDYRTMGLFFVVSFVVVLLYLLAYHSGIVLSIVEISRGLIHPTLILNSFLMLIAVYGVLILKKKLRWTDVGLKVKKLPIAFVVGLITWFLIQIIEGTMSIIYTGALEIEPNWNTNGLELIGLLFGMLLGTALYEEIGYRGFLLVQFKMKMENVTSNRALQIALALIISQTFFTLIHIPWKVMNQGWTTAVFLELIFSVFMNGIIYGLFYLRTENIFFVMFVHAFGNAPTSLFTSYIDPSILLLLLAIVWAIMWPRIRKWENKEILSTNDWTSNSSTLRSGE